MLILQGLGYKQVDSLKDVGGSKNQGYLFGVPVIRIIVVGDLYWDPLFRESTIDEL